MDNIGNMFGLGVPGGLLLAITVILTSWFIGRKNRSIDDIKKDLTKSFKQDTLEKKIESLEQEQVKIEAKIKETDDISVEQQDAIRNVVDKTSEVVQQILKEKNPSEVKRKFQNAFNKL